MSEFFNSSTSEKNPFEELAVVYVLYFDEASGHIPLLIYPDDRYKDDRNFMRPIKYHPIWFLSVNEQEALDHIDLEFKGYTFFGKKFLTKSKRKKRRAGLEEETPETIVIILSLPNNLEIFGDDLLRKLTEKILGKFDANLFEIIEAEIVSQDVIKSPKTKKIIEKGNEIKEQLRELIDSQCANYFSKAIKKHDPNSLKMQKAISYLALKGIDVSHIESEDYKGSFSSIKLFDPSHKSELNFNDKGPFSISNITISDNTKEMEILAINNTKKEMDDITVKITHVKDYFEKEIMNQFIDLWFPEEELVFVSPIIPRINEYLFFIINEKNNETCLSKRIDLDIIREIRKK